MYSNMPGACTCIGVPGMRTPFTLGTIAWVLVHGVVKATETLSICLTHLKVDTRVYVGGAIPKIIYTHTYTLGMHVHAHV